jgi:DNA-binding LytR/AlgR family response regulator
MPRVLIVEDEPMVAMDLESTVKEIIAAEVVVAPSVSRAREAMAGPLDFAFLDIEVTDGKTFEIALELRRHEVPFVSSRAVGPRRFLPTFSARRSSPSLSRGI